ncbi:MAG: hypothetical protein FWC72_05235, partial [Oscillospiraceae bacterium]|nr:hypothetical protein [Oscillospiraceae bacterium]
FHNPEVDDMLDEATSSRDQARRQELYTAVQVILMEEMPSIPLFYQFMNLAFHVDLYVPGFPPTLINNFDLMHWTR